MSCISDMVKPEKMDQANRPARSDLHRHVRLLFRHSPGSVYMVTQDQAPATSAPQDRSEGGDIFALLAFLPGKGPPVSVTGGRLIPK
jgi:hypothetical protein